MASIEAQRNLIHSDVKFDDLEQGKVSVPASSETPTQPEEAAKPQVEVTKKTKKSGKNVAKNSKKKL
jgi:hypothetical protein